MIKDCGVNWVILGHSERRHVFGESDEVSLGLLQSNVDFLTLNPKHERFKFIFILRGISLLVRRLLMLWRAVLA